MLNILPGQQRAEEACINRMTLNLTIKLKGVSYHGLFESFIPNRRAIRSISGGCE